MEEAPVQILEVRSGEGERPVTITAAITAQASRAIYAALGEELDQRRREPVPSPEDVVALREHVELMERFEPAASGAAHAILHFSASELRECLIALTDYEARVGGEHYQPPELRERLAVIGQITPTLWDANAAAAAASTAQRVEHAAQ